MLTDGGQFAPAAIFKQQHVWMPGIGIAPHVVSRIEASRNRHGKLTGQFHVDKQLVQRRQKSAVIMVIQQALQGCFNTL
jgi:hypothetical protein